MSDITLSLANRANLLSLQTTQSLLNRTSNRLSTGLKVNKPIDNAAAYFAAAALNKRADSFTTAQTNIQQTSNLLEVAVSALQSITKLVQTLQGTLSSLSTATDATTANSLQTQYNTILSQIDNLASSATYQGINLINTSTASVAVSFSGQPGASDISISAIRSDSAGLNLTTIAAGLFFTLTTTIPSQSSRPSFESVPSFASIASRAAVNVVTTTPAAVSSASVNSVASVASQSSTAASGTNPATPTQASIASIESVPSIASRSSTAAVNVAAATPAVASRNSVASIASVPSIATVAGAAAAAVNTQLITQVSTQIGNALSQLSAAQSTLGSTNAILAVRLEFSKSYVATQQQGASQLTVADLNEESANLTSLQTAQSLGVVSLSITNQAQQSLLRLF